MILISILSVGFLTLSLPVPRWAGGNTDQPSNSNTFTWTFFKEYLISFLIVYRLIDFALVVLTLLMFKVRVIMGISKIEFFNIFGTERVKEELISLRVGSLWNLFIVNLVSCATWCVSPTKDLMKAYFFWID